MKDIKLNVKDIPSGYALCFNCDCAEKDKCLHYQAKLLKADNCYKGQAVYPVAWQDGKCRCYNEKKLVQKAWGFSQLYRNIPSYMRAEAIMISPKRQEEIMEVLAKFGSTEGIKFDHYVKVWDFD